MNLTNNVKETPFLYLFIVLFVKGMILFIKLNKFEELIILLRRNND